MNIYDISKRAGVSIATVSRVLNNSAHVSPKTRQRVLSVMEENGFVPNAFARSLGLNSMKTIGLLCPNAADPYLAHALSYLEKALRDRQYNCLLSCCGRALSARQAGVELLQERHVDGIILMGSTFVESTPSGNDYIRKAAAHMPVFILNAALRAENVYCVLCDEQQATKEAAQYLIDTGCKHILYLYHSRNYNGMKKLNGYREGLLSRNLTPDERLIHFVPEDEADVQHVRDLLLHLSDQGLSFDAVLSSEDILSIGAVKYAHKKGLKIPDRLSIIGYNNSVYGLCCEPELSSVDNRLNAVCDTCASLLLGVLEGKAMPQTTVFNGEIIRRESTRTLSHSQPHD